MVIQMGKKKINYFILIFRIISIIIIAICLYVLYEWHLDNKANNSLQNDLEDLVSTQVDITKEKIPPIIEAKFNNIHDDNDKSIAEFNVDFNSLSEMNSDSVAWIRIPNTNISYPILQSNDKDKEGYIKLEKSNCSWCFPFFSLIQFRQKIL